MAAVRFLLFFCLIVCCFGADLDGDGFDSDPAFGEFQDCCDTVDDGCYDPYLVNPGAWEIPNNGITDRCFDDSPSTPPAVNQNNLPDCDYKLGVSGFLNGFIGPTVTPSATERAITAMDICEFKDDDDDPSWGFARQENMVFSLVDGTRNGYDLNVIGPDDRQASVSSGFGRISPAKGAYMLAISTGCGFDTTRPGFINPSFGLDAISDDVNPPTSWRTAGGSSGVGDLACDKTVIAQDSVMATFSMQQPTNMGAWSVKVIHLETQDGRTVNFGAPNVCTDSESFLLVLHNDTTSPDGNVALTRQRTSIRTNNPDLDFFTFCDEFSTVNNQVMCPNSYYRLQNTGFFNPTPGYAPNWTPIGSKSTPGKPFQLRFATWDRSNPLPDTTILIDDYLPIAEARGFHPVFGAKAPPGSEDYGYQFTSDVELTQLTPAMYTPGVTRTQIDFEFTVKNNGPQVTKDVAINFTPPMGTSFASISAPWDNPRKFIQPGLAPYQDNGFHKFFYDPTTLATDSPSEAWLQVGESFSGVITLNILSDAPREFQFKVSTTCSSIENIWNNNYIITEVYV